MIAIVLWAIFIIAVVNGLNWNKGKPAREAEAKRVRDLPPMSPEKRRKLEAELVVLRAQAKIDRAASDAIPWRYKH